MCKDGSFMENNKNRKLKEYLIKKLINISFLCKPIVYVKRKPTSGSTYSEFTANFNRRLNASPLPPHANSGGTDAGPQWAVTAWTWHRTHENPRASSSTFSLSRRSRYRANNFILSSHLIHSFLYWLLKCWINLAQAFTLKQVYFLQQT